MKLVKIITILVVVMAFGVPTQALAAATLGLSPSSGSYNRSCNFSVQLVVNTGGAQINGVDAILNYDPTRLTPTKLTNGTIFSDYPSLGNKIDTTNNKIYISGLTSVTSTYVGSGTVATIDFTVPVNAPTGLTQVTFDFTPGATNDSNVAEASTVQDILGSVTNGSYTIGTGSCAPSTGSTTTGQVTGNQGLTIVPVQPNSTAASALINQQDSGDATMVYILTAIGVMLTLAGILGLALL